MIRLSDIKGVGDVTVKKLKELNIRTVFELLSYFPAKYVDLKSPIPVCEAAEGETSLFSGIVISVSKASSRGKRGFRVRVADTSQSACDTSKEEPKSNARSQGAVFYIDFYNQPYLSASFEAGKEYIFLAKPLIRNEKVTLVNPVFEAAEKRDKLDGVFTIYPLRGIIGQNTFKNILKNAFNSIDPLSFEGKSAELNRNLIENFKAAHFPNGLDEAETALRGLAEIDMSIAVAIYKKSGVNSRKNRKVFYNFDKNIIDEFKKHLTVVPTESQNNAFAEITADLQSDYFMSRIIMGDVGSGKTLTAFFAMYAAAMSGMQSALMAPTEILCRQHAENFAPIAKAAGIRYAVLTSGTPSSERRQIVKDLKSGEIAVAIGTQSLLGAEVEYKNLALAVIDEQHKFGVAERAKIEEKGAKDILSLTATPIPRSLALAFCDNIDISRIEKRKSARTDIVTKTVEDSKLADMLRFIACEAEEGRQSFVVCPTIKNSEGYDVYSLETLFTDYGEIFGQTAVSVLHGRLSSERKRAAMSDFSEGRTGVLFATTVIEVGIDTKARNIAILNADRFGLATLHQLRGRVGRDGSSGYCFLHSSSALDSAAARLEAVCRTCDGNELAEIDFASRGAGEFLGLRQSGRARTPSFGLPFDSETLKSAGRLAERLVSDFSEEELLGLTRLDRARAEEYSAKLRSVTLNS